MASLLIALVLGSDGKTDKAATLASCGDAIDLYTAERETEEATIADAVGALFDEHKGAALNMPYVCNEACRSLNVQPANFKALTERVAEYVREHAQGEKVGETWERPESEFVISKGKGGGVRRRADIPPPPAAK